MARSHGALAATRSCRGQGRGGPSPGASGGSSLHQHLGSHLASRLRENRFLFPNTHTHTHAHTQAQALALVCFALSGLGDPAAPTVCSLLGRGGSFYEGWGPGHPLCGAYARAPARPGMRSACPWEGTSRTEPQAQLVSQAPRPRAAPWRPSSQDHAHHVPGFSSSSSRACVSRTDPEKRGPLMDPAPC